MLPAYSYTELSYVNPIFKGENIVTLPSTSSGSVFNEELYGSSIFLTVDLVNSIYEGSLQDKSVDKVFAEFIDSRSKTIAGILQIIGLAIAGPIARALWLKSVPWLTRTLVGLGLVAVPAWVTTAGIVSGLLAASGAMQLLMEFSRHKNKQYLMKYIANHAKSLIRILSFHNDLIRKMSDEDINDAVKKIFIDNGISVREVNSILTFEADELERAGNLILDDEKKAEAAIRILFPLAYISGDYNDLADSFLKDLCIQNRIDPELLS